MMSDQKLKFSALEHGDRFICWPLPGNNSGHGNGVETTIDASMDVIKVLLR